MTLIHYVAREQVEMVLRRYLSDEAAKLMRDHAMTARDLQRLRETQEQRRLEALIDREFPPALDNKKPGE